MQVTRLSAALVLVLALAARAEGQTLSFQDGRVSIKAEGIPAAQVLAEWARTGKTEIVNGDKVVTPPLSLALHDIAEADLLQKLLAAVGGYVVVPKTGQIAPGESAFARILILPTAAPASPSVSPAPRAAVEQPWPLPMNLDPIDTEPLVLLPMAKRNKIDLAKEVLPLPMNIEVYPEDRLGGRKIESAFPPGQLEPWVLPMNLPPPDDGPPSTVSAFPPGVKEPWVLPMNLDPVPWEEPRETSTLTGDDGLPILVYVPLIVGLEHVPGRLLAPERPVGRPRGSQK